MTERDTATIAAAIFAKSRAAAQATNELRSIVANLDRQLGNALERFYPGDIAAMPFQKFPFRLSLGRWNQEYGLWIEKRQGETWVPKSRLMNAALEEIGPALDSLPQVLTGYDQKLTEHLARADQQVKQVQKLAAALAQPGG